MRTSHKAKDAAAERQSYVCDTFTGHGKAHQPHLPGFTGQLIRGPGCAHRPYRPPPAVEGGASGLACPCHEGHAAASAGRIGSRIRRPQVPGSADRIRGDALHVAVQASFVTTVDGNRQDRYRTVLGAAGLGRHRPALVPQAPGEVRGLGDDGDADHSGGEPFAGHKPEQYAEPDADGVGNDAGCLPGPRGPFRTRC